MHVKLPMMMYGSYTGYEKDGLTGKKVRKKITHIEENGDVGFFPSVNHIYMNTRNGGKKLTKAAEDLKERWKEEITKACEQQKWDLKKKEKVIVNCYFYFPDKRMRDTNNIFKLLMDSMEGIVFENDYYALPRVMDFEILKDKTIKPYIDITIELN